MPIEIPILRSSVFMVALAASSPAAAQDTIDPSEGRRLAEHWCSQCHDIRPDGHASPNDRAPPFAELAAAPGFNERSLRAMLWLPHLSMPQIKFTPDEMDDITAYFSSLNAPR